MSEGEGDRSARSENKESNSKTGEILLNDTHNNAKTAASLGINRPGDNSAENILPDGTPLLNQIEAGEKTSRSPSSTKDLYNILDAKLVGRDGDNRESLEPLRKLDRSGDYTIRFANGREFLLHMPELTEEEKSRPLPVMLMIPGIYSSTATPKMFVDETNINAQADNPNGKAGKFAVVTALSRKHLLTENAKVEAYGWDVDGALKPPNPKHPEEKNADVPYFLAVINQLPRIANVSSDPAKRSCTGFSQGGAALLRLAGMKEFEGAFPNINLVATTAEERREAAKTVANYEFARGNGLHTMIIRTDGDKNVLALPENQLSPMKRKLAQTLLKLSGLDGIDTVNQDPRKVADIVARNLGQAGEYIITHLGPADPKANLKTFADFTVSLGLLNQLPQTTKGDQMFVYRLKNEPQYDPADPNNLNGVSRELRLIIAPFARHFMPGEGKIANPDQYAGIDGAKLLSEHFRAILASNPVKAQQDPIASKG
jgi:hypothetical protein